MQAEQQSERERFEAWARSIGKTDRDLQRDDWDGSGEYSWITEKSMWSAWQARAALSHPSTPQGWISVNDALPPEREMVAVGWMDVEDHDHADRYSIDFLDDGVWQFYFSEHEHYLIAGVAKGRSEDAPYTHWHRIGKIPAPPEQGGKG